MSVSSHWADERGLTEDEEAWVSEIWLRRIDRLAEIFCKKDAHLDPKLRKANGDPVRYCGDCYWKARHSSDYWAEVLEQDAAEAVKRARDGEESVGFVPVASALALSAGHLNPSLRVAVEGYGVV